MEWGGAARKLCGPTVERARIPMRSGSTKAPRWLQGGGKIMTRDDNNMRELSHTLSQDGEAQLMRMAKIHEKNIRIFHRRRSEPAK